MLPLSLWNVAFVINGEPATDNQHLCPIYDVGATAPMAKLGRSRIATVERKDLNPGERRDREDIHFIICRIFAEAESAVEVSVTCEPIDLISPRFNDKICSLIAPAAQEPASVLLDPSPRILMSNRMRSESPQRGRDLTF